MPLRFALAFAVFGLVFPSESRAFAQQLESPKQAGPRLAEPPSPTVVAPEAHGVSEEPRLPNDARWLEHPVSMGFTALLGVSHQTNAFLLAGVDVDYALPYISLG
jgi:hypothetical protein